MFRGHEGAVLFDDVTVSAAAKAQCQCRDGEHFDPSPSRRGLGLRTGSFWV
jgi:hypothetical protein